MMKPTVGSWGVLFALLLLTCAGCGDQTTLFGAPADDPGPPPGPTVESVEPSSLKGELPTPLVITGSGFGAPGDTAWIVLEAVAGTPFHGGTSRTTSFPARVESDTRITATTPVCGVSGAVGAIAAVFLASAESIDVLITIQGPTLTAFDPELLISGLPKGLALAGTGLGSAGTPATVRFTALMGTPFAGGLSATLDVPVLVESPTRVIGEVPAAQVTWPDVADVRLICPSGAEAALFGAGVNVTPDVKLVPPGAVERDHVGEAVGISGDRVIVGAPGYPDGGTGAGAAFVYVRRAGAYELEDVLAGSDAPDDGAFGRAVAMDGDHVIVGNSADTTQGLWSGAAYLYARVGGAWVEQQKLLAPDGTDFGGFGHTVAIHGDTAVVGSSGLEAAYVYARSGVTWAFEGQLKASDAAAGDDFGWAVAISGETIVVGADRVDKAYVFTRSGTTWTEQQILTSSSASKDTYFGRSVAISGDSLAVGALTDDDQGSSAGAAYLFDRVGGVWTETVKVYGSGATADRLFGRAVALSGDRLIVGADSDDELGSRAGAFFYFERLGDSWVEVEKLMASDGSDFEHFGHALAIDGDTAVVGTNPHYTTRPTGVGAAYVH